MDFVRYDNASGGGEQMIIEEDPGVRLNELDKDEFWDVIHHLKPEITRAEYDRHWDEFQARKRLRKLN